MTRTELVTVIIPAYNAVQFIAETLDSVCVQTYDNLEIIVVNDGSTDQTATIITEKATEDPRIRLISQPNGGVAKARNLGIAHASGNYIAFIDADDLWHSEKLAKQMSIMQQANKHVGLVYTWSSIIDEWGNIIFRAGMTAPHNGDVYCLLVLYNFIGNCSSPLIRREYLAEGCGFDPSLRARGGQGCEDLKFYLAVAERYDFSVVPEFLVGYRISAESMSQNELEMVRSYELVMTAVRRRYPELPQRLFRWSRGGFCFWHGGKLLRRGQIQDGLRLVFRGLCCDPSLPLQPWIRQAVLRNLVCEDLKNRLLDRMDPGARGQDFLSASPIMGADTIPHQLKGIEKRRQAFAASLPRPNSQAIWP